jgi:hypothetical protein
MKYLGTAHNRLFFLLILVLAIIVTSIEGNLARLGRQLIGGDQTAAAARQPQPVPSR